MHSLLGAIAHDQAERTLTEALPNDSDTPVYACSLQLQRAAVPVRLAALDEHGLPDVRLIPRPTIEGAQTAIVVGDGQPVHTDRDHRIKIQFHWQRGDRASHTSAADRVPVDLIEVGQPVLVQLALADASHRGWHGHVTQAALLGSDGGLARYRLTVEPWPALLGHRQDSWVFQGQTGPAIIDEVFADHLGLMVAWRWELADHAAHPHRSLCKHYQKTVAADPKSTRSTPSSAT